MGATKRQHYVPRFYLKRFADPQDDYGRLFVFEKKTGRSWASTPRDAGCENYFYQVETTGGADRQALEKVLGKVEQQVAPVLMRTLDSGELPAGTSDSTALMNLVAMMILRTPGFRTVMKRAADLKARQRIHQMVESPEAWSRICKALEAEDIDLRGMTYDGMKEFVESGRYDIQVDMGRNAPAFALSQGSDLLLMLLAMREWQVVTIADDALAFLSSDDPVSLTRMVGWKQEHGFGFQSPRTMLTFPLGRNVALVGTFENVKIPSPAPRKTVAIINSATIRGSDRYFYSCGSDFIWMDKGKTMRDTAAWKQAITPAHGGPRARQGEGT